MDRDSRGNSGYALILSGGGAKGCYQIGAWRALRELGINFSGICGASVGAINGSIIAQGDYDTAARIWGSITLDSIVEIPPELIKNGSLNVGPKNLGSVRKLFSPWLDGLSLDTTPLRTLLLNNLIESAVRSSGIDFGLVAVNLPTLKPLEVFLDEIPPGELVDYLMATASFPFFKSQEIDGRKFIDGGLHDNLPFAMMKERGYRRFIIVDVSGPGINRRPDIRNTETIYIKNSLDLGGVLDFSPDFISSYTRLGYLDAMRVFGRLVGKIYYVIPDTALTSRLEKVVGKLDPITRQYYYDRSTLPKEYLKGYLKDPILPLVECAARTVGVPSLESYKLSTLINLIWENRGDMATIARPLNLSKPEGSKQRLPAGSKQRHSKKSGHNLQMEIAATSLLLKILYHHYGRRG